MNQNFDTAYLVVTPNPNDYENTDDFKQSPLWIKFGDTDDVENTRISGYDTHNPSFYALTIRAEEGNSKLGKKLETEILQAKAGYEQVTIENRVGADGKTEWYRVNSDVVYGKVTKLFQGIDSGNFHGVKGEKLGKGKVWGKVVDFTAKTPDDVVKAFKGCL